MKEFTYKQRFSPRFLKRYLSKGITPRILFEGSIISILYLLYCMYFFSSVWYTYLLTISSAILVGLNYIDLRMEMYFRAYQNDIIRTFRKLRYYLLDTNNIYISVSNMAKQGPKNTRKEMLLLKEALESTNTEDKIKNIKKATSTEWLKILCDIIYHCKQQGNEGKVTSNNLGRMLEYLESLSIQQGLDTAELLGIQMLIYLLPIVSIPGIQLFQRFMVQTVSAGITVVPQNLDVRAITILFFSNLCALYIAWIRKNS